MTDNEIIKALVCCGNPLYYCNDRDCKTKTMGNALDLINRLKVECNKYRNKAQTQKSELARLYKLATDQKAEIERLEADYNDLVLSKLKLNKTFMILSTKKNPKQ